MKKLLSAILAAVMLFSLVTVGTTTAWADTPTQAGKVFAGYYTDDTYTTPSATETDYPKFVDENVLQAKYQLTANANEDMGSMRIRVVTTIDSLHYQAIGFHVWVDGVQKDVNGDEFRTTRVATTIKGTDGLGVFEYTPDVFSPESMYFCAYNFSIAKAKFGSTLTFQPYWITMDGTEVTGNGGTDGDGKRDIIISESEGFNNLMIGSASELYDFATSSKSKNYEGWKIKLTADIDLNEGWEATSKAAPTGEGAIVWTPIGTTSTPFAGTFDGQGHTISGVYLNATVAGQGFFASTAAGATVRDFKLKNSYLYTNTGNIGHNNFGSIAGTAAGKFEKIYSDAIVEARLQRVGGLIGATASGGVTMNDCWFAGSVTIKTNSSYLGGLIGDVTHNSTINNCLNTAPVRLEGTPGTTGVGGFIGHMASATVNITNSVNSGEPYQAGGSSKTGNIADLVGYKQSGTLNLSNSHSILYKNNNNASMTLVYVTSDPSDCGRFTTDQAKGLSGYKNFAKIRALFDGTVAAAAGHWVVTEDTLPVLSLFAEEYSTRTLGLDWYGDGTATTFTLLDAHQLLGFAAMAQTMNFAGKTVQLGADIDLNEGWTASSTAPATAWTPIGTTSTRFNGTFDGQGHTIRGVYLNATTDYQGLFGGTDSSAVIRDFKLKNSYLTTTKTQLGSIVGNAGGTFEKIYSEAIVYGKGNYVGGLIGINGSGKAVTMTDCVFAGSATINAAASYLGGLTGGVQSGGFTINNCLNTGEVAHKYTGTLGTAGAGGFVGTAQAAVTITNSANHTNPSYQKGSGNGLFVGYGSGAVTLTNCHAVDPYSKALVNGQSNSTYTTCTRQAVAGVAGLKSLLAEKVQNLFAGSAQGHWLCSESSLPILSYFADEYSTFSFDTDWYEVGADTFTLTDAGDLYGFAAVSQLTNFAGKTVQLGADIDLNPGCVAGTDGMTGTPTEWTPIGTIDVRFNGIFDGQGHTIRGVYLNNTNQYQGLFVATDSSAVIRDFKLKNSYLTTTNTNLGSIVGYAGGTFEKIYSEAIVYGQNNYVGGLAGANGYGKNLAMTDCWFAGSVTMNEAKARLGGLVGLVQSGTTTIDNCLNTGEVYHKVSVASAYTGGFVGQVSGSGAVLSISGSVNHTNAAYTAGTGNGLFVGSNGSITLANCHAVNYGNKALVSGQSNSTYDTCTSPNKADVAGLKSLTTEKVQDLFLSDSTQGHWVCSTDSLPVLSYFADEYSNGTIAVNAGWYDEEETDFTLTTAAEFYVFAILSQTNNFAGKTVKLGADIDLNPGCVASTTGMTGSPTAWTPIGSTTTRFAGTFDGQGYTVSGVYLNATADYQGLFGGTDSGAVIRNFKLKNSYLTTTGQHLGSIVGNAGGTFEKIYSDAIVYGQNNYVGGLIGSNGYDKAVTMTDCAFAGSATMNVGGKGRLGGLIGLVQSGGAAIDNCLNTGEVAHKATHTSDNVGGFVGQANVAISISNSVNHTNPTYTAGGAAHNGLFVGYASNTGAITLTNCHALNCGKHLVYGVNDDTTVYPTCSRQNLVDVVGLKAMAAEKIAYLFTADGAQGHWVCRADSFPVLSCFADEYSGTIAVDLAADETDATTLGNLYAGRTLYQGELHNHADTSVNSTDGTSDGYVTLDVWYDQMGTLGLDFANSLDHQQTSHIDAAWSAWDTSKLVYGTEAGTWVPSTVSGSTQLHYSMLFRTKAQLEQVLNAFEEFNYGGSNGNPGWTKSRDGRTNNGSAEFTYPNFTRERFAQLMEAVKNAGGFFVLPHPFTLAGDTQKVSADYDFGVDGIGFEVKLTAGNHEWDNRMYTGWEELLASGAKIYACAGNDNHTNLDNTSLTSIYGTSDAVSDKGYLVDQLRAGDFVAGSAGIKMCVGNTAMGGSCSFSGQRVVIDVEKIHTIANDLSHQYRLDVISDKGVVCRKELTVDSTNGMVDGTELAFDADASCAFYRVVVVDITAGNSRIAIGNPIWNSSVQ